MDNGASSYRRFLEGDESAFDEIMKELFDGLVFFIDRYVHDIHAAEDIAIGKSIDGNILGRMNVMRPRILPSMLFPIWWSINIGTISR